jgi:hypothetical protein
MILKQNIPYAALIYSALDLCDLMLARSNTLYPFAVISIDNDVQSVFTQSKDGHAPSGMIEELEMQLCEQRIMAESSVSVLVYSATITSPHSRDNEQSDAIVFNITDSNGKNTITLYPYTNESNRMKLGAPFTCDFSD